MFRADVEAWNERIVKNVCASSWLITKINILRCTVSKPSKYFSLFVQMQWLHKVRSLDIVSEFQWSTVTFWLTWNYSVNFLYVHSISPPSLLTLSCQYIILYRDFPLLWIPGDWSIKNDRTASIDSSSCSSNSSSISFSISSSISYLFKNMWHIQVTDIPFTLLKILTLWLLREHEPSMYSGHSYHTLPIKHY